MKKLVFAIVCLVGGVFLTLLSQQRSLFTPENRVSTLVASGKMRVFHHWAASFYDCYKQLGCAVLNETPLRVKLPISLVENVEFKNFVTKNREIPEGARREVRLTRNLELSELAFVRQLEANAFLVLPTQQNFVSRLISPYNTSQFGHFVDHRFFLTSKALLAKEEIAIKLQVSDMGYFGPAEHPPFLVDALAARDVMEFGSMNSVASQLTRQIDIGLPFVIAGLALVVDHSKVLPSLALFAGLRALRSFVYGFFEFQAKSDIALILYVTILLINTLTMIGLLSFIANIYSQALSRKKLLLAGLVSMVCNGCIYFSLDNPFINYWVEGDLYFDGFLGFVGLIATLYYILQRFAARDEHGDANKPNSKRTTMAMASQKNFDKVGIKVQSRFQALLKDTLLLLGFGSFFWVNVEGTALSANADIFDWKHLALIPCLLVASFLEVGSIVKTILKVATVFEEKAKIDRDLEISKQIQKDTLPDKRFASSLWAWRALHRPASSLAGDWFDIRGIESTNGKSYLVGIVADVTGHGIGSALMTSNIASHWSLWCGDLSKLLEIKDNVDFAGMLAQAPSRIHSGLIGLRYNLGCSLAAFLFDAETGSFYYLTAGHPGILSVSKVGFNYLVTQGTRPGSPSENPAWQVKHHALKGGESIYVYSDGLAPIGEAITRWVSHLKKKWQKESSENIDHLLVRQFRDNRKKFRQDPDIEDDLTLLFIRLEEREHVPTEVAS